MKKIFILFGLTVVLGLMTSCRKFLDVQPSGTLPEGKMYSDVQGFRDAMYGVYASMAKPELYGSNLSFGFADKLGQMLLIVNEQHVDADIRKYDYLNANVRPTIDQIWSAQYKVISYVNLTIAHLEKTQLTHSDLDLIRGEAYGLRAFLHFDLLRLFSEDYLVQKDARGIPYAYDFDLKNKKLYTIQETYANIISDLEKAEKYLEKDDEIKYGEKEGNLSSIYRANRYVHFNKWAVKATLARVYYHMGDYKNAEKYARAVIGHSSFHLSKSTDLEQVRRFPAFHETIFGLNTSYLNETIRDLFLKTIGSGETAEARRDLTKLYETKSFSATNIDKRFDLYYKSELSGYRFVRFLKSNEELTNAPLTGIQLIRLPEMYYILAEALYDTNKAEAVRVLNVLRASRGLQEPLADSKSSSKVEFQKELLRERMREMPGEGQVFHSLKHYNVPFAAFDGSQIIEPSSKIFVLPWPQKELDFGNI